MYITSTHVGSKFTYSAARDLTVSAVSVVVVVKAAIVHHG